jgi:hypothetical protein
MWRHRVAGLRALGQCMDKRVDALFEMTECVAGSGDMIELVGEATWAAMPRSVLMA